MRNYLCMALTMFSVLILNGLTYAEEIQFSEKKVIGQNLDGAYGIYVADVDGDGFKDVLGANAYSATELAWWRNTNGDGSIWEKNTIADEILLNPGSIVAADIDKNGTMDVFVNDGSSARNDIILFKNINGIGTEWEKILVEDSFLEVHSISLADIDGDTDMDVLGAATTSDKIAWWENPHINGDGLTWTRHDVAQGFDRAISVHAADINLDGYIDIIATAYQDAEVAWFENPGNNESPWIKHLVSSGNLGARYAYAVDIDNDGDDDIIGAVRLTNEVTWWENPYIDGDGSTWIKHSIDASFGGAYWVFAADIDGDSDMDVLGAASSDNEIAWWKNPLINGDGITWVKQTVDANFIKPFAVYSSDLDDDGKMDIIAAAVEGNEIAWWRNQTIVTDDDKCSQAIFEDDFEDGVIDTNQWIVGGATRGWSMSQPTGIGSWNYSYEEIIDPSDGYLNLRVWGPTSGNTYGAESWVRTTYNFNDGNVHIINFTWQPVVDPDMHYNAYFIQITDDNPTPSNGSVHWAGGYNWPGTVNLLSRPTVFQNGWFYDVSDPGYPTPDKFNWSIYIDPSGVARLYDTPSATGSIISEENLDLSYPWHMRFMVIDATSAGFSAGDTQLILYNFSSEPSSVPKLQWPIDCIPGETCFGDIGYPDIDGDGYAFDCGLPGYTGHQGTDIGVTWGQMDNGVSVYAAADGEVLWVFDGKYDRCPNPSEPDCQAPPPGWFEPSQSNGYRVCTEEGPYCGTGWGTDCFLCFDGGNVIVIRHFNTPGVFATRYDHLKKNSILVSPGQPISKGQKIAEAGSAGHSTGPHLHFEVWGSLGFYEHVEPWAGSCGPNFDNSLWEYNPPWQSNYCYVNCNGLIGELCISAPNDCDDTRTGNYVCTADGSDTECDALQPAERDGYGDSCVSASNNCGDTNAGVNVCAAEGVECNAVQPPERNGYGDSCVSASNNCGDTSSGVMVCTIQGVECDAVAPDDRPQVTVYMDVDGDGYGDIGNPVDATCGMPSDAVEDSLDCNDNDSSVTPGAEEICNGIDDNCSGGTSELDPWTYTSSLNIARQFPGVMAYNGYVYAAGGSGSSPYLNVVEYAQISTDGTLSPWTIAQTALNTGRSEANLVANNGYLYIVGGWRSGQLSSVEYAPIVSGGAPGTWSLTSSLNTPRFAHGVTVHNGFVYAVGGRTNGGGGVTNTVEMAQINPDGTFGAWTYTSSMNTPRQYLGVAVDNDYIYAISGDNFIGTVEYAPINIDGTLGAWTIAEQSLNIARRSPSATVRNGTLYIVGGTDISNMLSSSEYAHVNPDGAPGAWNISESVLLRPRGYIGVAIYSDFIYAVAGYDKTILYLNTVEMTRIAQVDGIDEGFNVGDICISPSNSCGDINSGNFVCTADGSGTECDALQPAERDGYGDVCVSASNNCGDTSSGVMVCAIQGVECDAVAPDDRPAATAFIDADDDGFGDINSPVDATCEIPDGAVDNSSDCDVADPLVNPGMDEICNGIDDNCDGNIDEGLGTGLQEVYTEDFSYNPGWTTNNNPSPHYWDSINNTYYVDSINVNGGGYYSYYDVGELGYYGGSSFRLEWDTKILSSGYASGLGFGLYDSTMYADAPEGNYAMVVFLFEDRGHIIRLQWTDNSGHHEISVPIQFQFSNNIWYNTILEYDNIDKTLTAEVFLSETGERLSLFSATNVGPFDLDMEYLGSSNYRSGNFQVPGAHTTGNIDNVKFSAPVPIIETCNGVDDNCDGNIDEGFNAGDICVSSANSCGDYATGSYVCTLDGSGTECNTVQPAERAGYGDFCISSENNCGDTNDGVMVCAELGVECDAIAPDDRPQVTVYMDADADGYGDINNPVDATCGMPADAVEDSSDCNDNDNAMNPGLEEICDLKDNDCNGFVDDGVYVFGGFQQPINPDGSSIFKAGRTIPVKISLADCGGTSISTATVTIAVYKITDIVLGTQDELEIDASGNANTGNTFRYADDKYIFNLSTTGFSGGTYRVYANPDDGSSYSVMFSLK